MSVARMRASSLSDRPHPAVERSRADQSGQRRTRVRSPQQMEDPRLPHLARHPRTLARVPTGWQRDLPDLKFRLSKGIADALAPGTMPSMEDDPLTSTRRALHGVAELLIAGPQYRVHGTIRLRVTPGGFGGVMSDTRVEGADLVNAHRRRPLTGTARQVATALGIDVGGPVGLYADGSGVGDDDPLTVDAAAVGRDRVVVRNRRYSAAGGICRHRADPLAGALRPRCGCRRGDLRRVFGRRRHGRIRTPTSPRGTVAPDRSGTLRSGRPGRPMSSKMLLPSSTSFTPGATPACDMAWAAPAGRH